MHWRARTEAGNDQLLRYLRLHHLFFALYYAGGAALLLLLAWLNYVGSWGVAERGQEVLAVSTAIFVGACLGGAVIISHLYWSKAIVYARTGQLKHRKDMLTRQLSSLATSQFPETNREVGMQRVLRYQHKVPLDKCS